MCPICHEDEQLDGWCRPEGCQHRFHTSHILEYLSLSGRYECPMCNGEITALLLDDGTQISSHTLRSRFYAPPSAVAFKAAHGISLFSAPDESVPLPLTQMFDENHRVVQQAGFPTILLQLLDSNGEPCSPGADLVQVKVRHAGVPGVLYNDSATVQSEGQCTFSNLVLHIPQATSVSPDESVALTFEVVCRGEGVALPCHASSVSASVYFPRESREVTPALERAQKQRTANLLAQKKAQAVSTPPEKKVSLTLKAPRPQQVPASSGGGCGCVIA